MFRTIFENNEQLVMAFIFWDIILCLHVPFMFYTYVFLIRRT